MTDLLDALRSRPTPVVDTVISVEALEWLCADERSDLTDAVRDELQERGYLDDTAALTEAGAWARHVVTRDERQSIIVRTQRGTSFRTLELHHEDGVLFVVDDASVRDVPTETYRVGYAAFADISNLVIRWLAVLPLDSSDELDYESPLNEVLEAVKSDDSDTTLISIIVDDEATFDLLHREQLGYFALEVKIEEMTTVAESLSAIEAMPTATLTSLSALDIYLLLVDAFSTPAEVEGD